MEFVIQENNKKRKKRNLFEFRFRFMENDADDYTTESIIIPVDELEDDVYKSELEAFIKHIIACIELDSRGRGGIDSDVNLYRYYSKVEGWNRYCANIHENVGYDTDLQGEFEDDELTEDDYNEKWGYYIPTDTYGNFYNSYEKCEMVYFDDEGDEYKVSIRF